MRELLRFPGHDDSMRAVIFDARTTRLATADRHTVRVWELVRDPRESSAVTSLVNGFASACLMEGALGQWAMPRKGERRAVCVVK